MVRIAVLSAFGVLVAGFANAGSVQLGGVSGLTANYISQGAGAVCAAGAGNCVTGSESGFSEANYQTTLFSGANNATKAFTGYAQTGGEASGLTMGGGTKPTFSMIAGDTVSDSNSATDSANFWDSTNSGSSSITVPVGVFDISDVWTMLQNNWGGLGTNDTSIRFNFGSASNLADGPSVTLNLLNSNATTGEEVRAAVVCATTPSAACSASTNPRMTPSTQTVGGVTVNGSQMFSNAYTAASGFYAGTAGNVKLDGQQFVFGSTYASDWLVSMTVTENNGSTYCSDCVAPFSQTALTAITVDTASAAPEPGTVLLLLTGLGCVGAARFRKGRS